MMFDTASFAIGIGVTLIGVFVSVAFFEPLLLAIVPSRVRFASFKAGKRLRLRKLGMTVFVRTSLSLVAEEPLSQTVVVARLQAALPLGASLDKSRGLFVIEDAKNQIKLKIETEQRDYPEFITITGELGSIGVKELPDRLLAFHVGYTDVTGDIRAKETDFIRESRNFYVEMKAEGEPDLIRFLRDASLSPSDTPLDITVKPKGFSSDVIFSDHIIRTTGDMGDTFIKGLRALLTIYS